jgi:hypothetical protein
VHYNWNVAELNQFLAFCGLLISYDICGLVHALAYVFYPIETDNIMLCSNQGRRRRIVTSGTMFLDG